ncbi:MAG TPA: serine hydrolase, partial [Thermoanaerobaculia bacterium]|nr:serine hydrolase [Thermoanaerobaculia bacterium]
ATGALLLSRIFTADSVALGQQAPAPAANVVAPAASVAGRAQAVVVEPSATTAETPRAGMLDPAGVEAFVDGFMTAYLEENDAVGGVVSIVENGHIVLAKGYGEDDRARHRAVEARRTLFRVGSVSKLFVWTAVMQLVERGKVDLDADVNRYLQGLAVPATYQEPVTLAHLMTHTAGFEDHVLGLFAHDATAVRPLRDLLAAELPVRVRAPGVVAAYSNHGAALAMLVVEQVSGMPWTEYVERQILGPLGMKRTTFRQPVPDALRDDVSIGYRNPSGQEPEAADFEYIPLAPAGAMSSTATDMARFMIAHLAGGQLADARILSEAAARRMHRTLHRHDPAVPGMAHGFIESDRNGRRVIGHGGDTLWFHTELELYPDQGIGIFASFNTVEAEPHKLTKAFADRYFAPADWTPQLAAADWADRARRFVGAYRSVRYSHHDLTKLGALASQVAVRDAGAGALELSSQPGTRWIQIEPLVFRDQEGTSTIAFREGKRGRITHLFVGEVPVFAFERVPWHESLEVHGAIAGAAIVLFAATVVIGPAGALLRRRLRAPAPKPQTRLPMAARAALWLGALVFIVLYTGLAFYLFDPLQIVFGLAPGLRRILLLPIVGTVLAAVSLLCALWIWRTRRGGAAARIAYTMVVVTFILVIWQLAVWRLFGQQG